MAYFCNITDAKDILSSYGATVATDDPRNGIGNPTQQDNCVERAHSRVLAYIHKFYDSTPNLGNTWLKWCTAYFTCVELLRRRGGNIPAGLEAAYAEYKDFLESIAMGESQIPEAIPRESGYGMAMSNVYHDHRFRDSHIRVTPRISAGEQSSDLPRDVDWDSNYPEVL